MTNFLQFVVSGLAQGCIYALLASGFVVIHRVTNVVNMAQGTVAVIGGFVCHWALQNAIPHGLSELFALAVCGGVGAVAGVVAIGRRDTQPLTSLIVTFGIAVFAYAVEIFLWGDQPVSYLGWEGSFLIGGVRLQKQYILIVMVTTVSLASLDAFFNRSYLGKAFTACHMNQYAARVIGIDPVMMGIMAFALGSVLGGIGGILITPLQSVSYDSDVHLAINGFTAAVIGGLLHPRMALFGAIFLGVFGELVAGYFNAAYKTEVTLAVMLLVMIFRARTRTIEGA